MEAINQVKWNQTDLPEFDGNYLCYINQPQECGNIWKYYKTVEFQFPKWIVEKNETVIYWTSDCFPHHIQPKPPR